MEMTKAKTTIAVAIFLWLAVKVVAHHSQDAGRMEKSRVLQMSERPAARLCGRLCHEMAAVTLYSGPAGATDLDTSAHRIMFSAYVLDRRIILTAGSSWESLLEQHSTDDVRICHVHKARPVSGKWTSCGKIRRFVYPKNYKGAGKAMDLVVVKISGARIGRIRKEADFINFGSIGLKENVLVYGYGSIEEGAVPDPKRVWGGVSRGGFDSFCGFGAEVDKGRYLCVEGSRPGEFFKPGDEGGLFVYTDPELGQQSVGGIVTNYKGAYGDVPMVLRFDKPNVENFLRRTTQKMQGELKVAGVADPYYFYFYRY